MKPGLSFLLSLSCISLSYAIASNSAKAQITPDGTTPTDVIEGNNESIITGGTNPSSGNNLFHSFSEFSVTPDNGAFFDNAPNIQNIFSRVTGANPSSIDGLIRANEANLFLINPNGIIYGNNASLQLGGSFYGSTADSILFSDGEFSAVNPDNTPILTINAPIGLSFRDNPASIDVRATAGDAAGVQITAGETLGFFGGDINLDSNLISAPGGTVELGGLSTAGTIEIAEIDNNFSFSFPEGVTRSNVTFNGATINVAGAGGGFINVNANNLTLSGASNFFAGIAEGLGSPEAQAGDINLSATGDINLSGVSSLQNRVNPSATGNSGNVNVTASSLNITEGAFISASTLGIGNGGDINVAVNGAVTIDDFVEGVSFSRLASVIGNSAEGDGGDININADSLSLSNLGLINTAIFPNTVNPDTGESIPGGRGDAGDIIVNTNNGIEINTGFIASNIGDGLSTNTGEGAVGSGGNISLIANGENSTISLSNGSFVSNTILPGAVGSGGEIDITANSLNLSDGGNINTSTAGVEGENGRSDAGDITINVTKSLNATGGSFLQSDTFGQGDAGNITINGENAAVSFDGVGENNVSSGIFSSVRNDFNGLVGNGRSGQITVAADSLSLDNGALINSVLDSGVTGQGDNISVTANTLSLANSSSINSSTSSEGDTGTISIQTNGSVRLSSLSNIFNNVESGARGNSNGVTINAGSLSVTEGSQIQTLVREAFENALAGRGNAGSITIDVDTAIVSGSAIDAQETTIFSQIASNVNQGAVGRGGEIEITADTLKLSEGGSIISTTAGIAGDNGRSDAGNIMINVSESLNLTGSSFLNSSTSGVGDSGIISIQSNGNGSIELSGLSNIFNNVESGARGNSNGVTINAGSLSVTEGSQIQTLVREAFENALAGRGNAGSITIDVDTAIVSGSADTPINAQETTFFSQIASNVNQGAVGRGGEIEITADTLKLSEGGSIISTTAGIAGDNGRSDAGDITISVSESLEATGGSFLQSDTFGQGDAGNITINGENASVSFEDIREDGFFSGIFSAVNSFTDPNTQETFVGQGTGGTIDVTSNSLTLSDGAQINTSSIGQGNGGDIALRIDNRLNLRENSVISATANGNNSGGNIEIDSRFIVAFPSNNNGNDILANNPNSGSGGRIDITVSEAILGIEERTPSPTTNDINADSGSGIDGDVAIDTPDVDTIQGAIQLPENVVEPDSTVTQACSSIAGTGSTLTVRGKGNVPPLPTAPLDSDDLLSGADSSDEEDVESSKPVSIDDIVPAQGAVIREDGSIFLTPYPTSQIASRLPQNSECNVESEIKSDKVLPDGRIQQD